MVGLADALVEGSGGGRVEARVVTRRVVLVIAVILNGRPAEDAVLMCTGWWVYCSIE